MNFFRTYLCVCLFTCTASVFAQSEWRTIDGSNNNPNHLEMGKPDTRLLRVAVPAYSDNKETPARAHMPSPREISNVVVRQPNVAPNHLGLSDMAWIWGQFLDHDISLTENIFPLEAKNMPVPTSDTFFDPFGEGGVVLPFNRSIYDKSSGLSPDDPREQLNEITTWIDASMVYGSDERRARALRSLERGKLKTSKGRMMPFNKSFPNAGPPLPISFLAGDKRVNENVHLMVMHTIWVREHNRLTNKIRRENPELGDEDIYQRARALVAAQIQVISYNEWLPAILGEGALEPYLGYDPDVDPRVANEFSTAAFRFGHTMLSSDIPRLDENLETIAEGDLLLKDAFFAPDRLLFEGGLDPLLRGACHQQAQEIDPYIIDDVRNFLFGDPRFGGFDLGALNIMRGRDHGLPDFNAVREAYGLAPYDSFAELSSDPEIQARLAQAYGDVSELDPWVSMLAEDKFRDAAVGETAWVIIKDQFERLRNGDRFWYQNTFSGDTLEWLERQTLYKVIKRNSGVKAGEIPKNVFYVP